MDHLFRYDNCDAYTLEYLKAIFKNFRLRAGLIGTFGVAFGYAHFIDQQLVLAGILFAAGAISFLTAALLVPLSLKEIKKQDVTLTGGEHNVTLRFLDEAVEMHQGDAHLRIQYAHIERVFETKQLHIFQLGKQNGFYLPKNAVKNPEILREILQGPLLNVPKRPRNFLGK